MRVGGYVRVSTAEQVEGYSLGAQRQAIADLCAARGWALARIYEDAGISGASDERPAFRAMLADAEGGALDVVAVWRLDRLSRDFVALELARRHLGALGIRLVSVADGVDTESSSWLDVAIRGVLSEAEARAIRERARLGKRARARAGRSNATFCPYGYRRPAVDTSGGPVYLDPEPDPETRGAVVRAFTAYAIGDKSDAEIAELLSRERYPAPSRAGRWIGQTVRYMLGNRFYIGEVRHGGEWFAGQHEPLIDAELFDRVQAARRARKYGGGPRTVRVHLLQGIAHCAHCRLPMHVNWGGGHRYLVCSAKARALPCQVGGRGVRQSAVDPQIQALVARLRLPEDWRERLEELAGQADPAPDIEGQRCYLAGKLARLRDLYIEGDFDRAEYRRRRAGLQAQLDGLRAPEPSQIERAGELLADFGKIYAGAALALQRDMLRTMFEAVYLDIGAARVVCVKPWPEFAALFRMDGLWEVEDGCFWIEDEEQAAGAAC
jgi:site-specific DNA recombinase